jgi:glycosyltransferase involved in cell wall biosynthesis
MRVVIDAVPITGASTAILTEHLLNAWAALGSDDELHVVIGPRAPFDLPPNITVHRVQDGRIPLVGRLWAQSVTLPRICRRIKPDIVLGLIASTTIAPLPCPRAILAYDMRHELRPEQFAGRTLLAKRVSYWLGYRQARAIACISERTRYDLMATHPELEKKIVSVMHLGADHTATWPNRDADEVKNYAIAFGQYSNKNVDLVLEGWQLLRERGDALPLSICGLPAGDRETVTARVAELGLSDLVTTLPWLPAPEFQAHFAAADVVVFPSDFEGFGLPAVEAMALGIPLVISPDAALLEVTGGHAVTLPGFGASALAEAVVTARALTPKALEHAKAHAATFTWDHSARTLRAILERAINPQESEPALVSSPGAA